MHRNNKSASTLLDYAIVLGVVSAMLITMNLYVKRGVQGKVKDMTDFIISDEQVGQYDTDPSIITNMQTATNQNATTIINTEIGGGTTIDFSEGMNIQTTSTAIDFSIPYPYVTDFTPASRGSVEAPSRDKVKEYDSQWIQSLESSSQQSGNEK